MILTILFICLLIGILWKLIKFAIKASWGILKILFFIIFAPAILVVLFASGLIYVALALALIMGVITVITTAIL